MLCCCGNTTDSESESFQGTYKEKETDLKVKVKVAPDINTVNNGHSPSSPLTENHNKAGDNTAADQQEVHLTEGPEQGESLNQTTEGPATGELLESNTQLTDINTEEVNTVIQEEIEILTSEVQQQKVHILQAIESFDDTTVQQQKVHILQAIESSEETDKMSQEALVNAVSRLEAVATRLENLAQKAPAGRSGSSEQG